MEYRALDLHAPEYKDIEFSKKYRGKLSRGVKGMDRIT